MRNTKIQFNTKWLFLKIIFIIYLSFYSFLVLSSLNENENMSTMMRIIGVVVALLLFIDYIGSEKLNLKEFLILCLCILLILLIELKLSSIELLIAVMFILCGRKVDFRSLVKIDITIKMICTIAIIVLCCLGYLKNIEGYYNGTYKSSLGFMHPNTLGCLWLAILVEWLFLRYEVLKVYDFLFCGGMYLICMKITNSRTSGYSFILIFVLYIVAKLMPNFYKLKFVKVAFCSLPFILAGISILITKLFESSNVFVTGIINHILSGRPFYQAYYWKMYGVKFFGQKFTGDFVLDNAYIYSLLIYGIVMFIFILFAYSRAIYGRICENDKSGLLFLSYWLLFGFGESYFLRIGVNVSLFLLGMKFQKKGSSERYNVKKIF